MTRQLNLGLVLFLALFSFQEIIHIEAGKSRCPYGYGRPKPISNLTCTTLEASVCNSSTTYRTHDGSCNNLANPLWGVPNSRFKRLLPAKYGDGLQSPRLARSGNNLPNARLVSTIIYPSLDVLDRKWTLLNMIFGQFVAHDMSLSKGPNLDCCSTDLAATAQCISIKVSSTDEDYGPLNVTCLPVTRKETDKDNNCSGKWNVAEQINAVNAYLDLSPVYGDDKETAASLRLNSQGLLKYEERNNQQWLPKGTGCFNNAEHCYIAGDVRVNQNPPLALLQTIYLREHNRIARKLAALNPSWDDEKLYQEARKINIAAYQIVTYNEWLPIILGSDIIESKRLAYVGATDFVNDYNKTINAAILNEHASAAFRFFHTLIAGELLLCAEDRSVNSSERLSDWWINPSLIEENQSSADNLIRGFTSQAEDGPDRFHSKEITINWLRQPNAPVGMDLKGIDIQRDRDHGLAFYNDIREAFNLPRATSFENLTDVMTKNNAELLASIYESVHDVELTVGGSLETITIGQGLAGPIFKVIMAEQFSRSRVGDRLFVENEAAGFTLTQLKELRKATISKLLCDNARAISTLQPAGFELISDSNSLTSCSSLPSMDISLWAET